MKPLPEETYLTPGEDLKMNIEVSGSISSEDDVIMSLEHSSRGVFTDLTEHLVYELYEEDDMEQEEGSRWKIEMTLPYPYSQASGNFTLSVGDGDSDDVTTTRLTIMEEGNNVAPFFDPMPKSVKLYPGQDVIIDTLARGSTPIIVSSKQ